MHEILDLFAHEPHMAMAVFVGLMGLMFLSQAPSRNSPAAKWLAGAALLFGAMHTAVLVSGLYLDITEERRAFLQTLVSVPSVAGVAAGVVALYRPERQAIVVFLIFLVALPAGVALTSRVFGSSPVFGTFTNAGALGLLAAWCWFHAPSGSVDSAQRSTSLVAALASFPVLVVVGVLAGFDLWDIRRLLTVPIGIIFVVLMTQILQMDARMVQQELQMKQAAEDKVRKLNETLEMEVQRRTEQLTQVNRGLQAFAGMVSHDLRAPVRNISGLAQMALEDFRNGRLDAQEAMLERISRESLRAGDMVTDLLTLAQVDNTRPKSDDVDMGQLIAECIKALSLQYPEAPRVVRVHAVPTIRGDGGLLSHVVINIVSNALKFGADRPGLNIDIGAEQQGEFWRFRVSDNGPGFDSKRASELFKPFVRLAGANVAGTGLGLTVVRRVVELHGGEVGAESVEGGGATFWWTIPSSAGSPPAGVAATQA